MPSSIVCNPLKPRLKLADPDGAAAANANRNVRPHRGRDRRATLHDRGLAYARPHRRIVAALKRIATEPAASFKLGKPDAVAAEFAGADLIVAGTGRPHSSFRPRQRPKPQPATTSIAFESTKPRDALSHIVSARPPAASCMSQLAASRRLDRDHRGACENDPR